jgi:uncharacterized repeat protein (TIGR02059 family)
MYFYPGFFKQIIMKKILFCLVLTLLVFNFSLNGQTAWYNSAQSRIDTLRKGNFTIKVLDSTGFGVRDSIKIIHKKHEFPWGTAYDLNANSNSGTTYSGSTASAIISKYGDNDIYKTERWGKYVAYELPAIAGKSYYLTLKLAEIYFSTANSRIFDVYVDGVRVMQNIDKYALANGKNIAFDTTIVVTAQKSKIKVEFNTLKDNVSINGLVLTESTNSSILRLNCGGSTITIGGKTYYGDNTYLNTTSAALFTTDDDWYKSVILKYCNYGVSGNQFKWSGIQPNPTPLNYAPFEYTMNWYTKMGLEMRAHTLLWGGNNSTDYHCIPQWVMNLSSTPKLMYDTCKHRVVREVTRYKGKIKEYDVLNEPYHANHLQKTVGDSINWNCFKWAHAADPDARLFVNDYNIIEWQDQTTGFINLVKKMLQNGAPISGIGAQCHIGSSVDLVNFKARFDQLAQFGLPIKITEFDMGAKSLSQQQYASEISKMMRLAFSHPAIEGFIFWGLTEPTWVPESIVNLIREDKTPKIAADSVYHLIHNVWTTKIADTTNINGEFVFKGYYGDYDVLIKENGKWEKHTISCKKAEKGNTIEIKAGTGKPISPVVRNIKIVEPNSIELTFNKTMANPAGEFKNFKMFDSKLNYIVSASFKSGDSATIVLTTNAPVKKRDYVPVSYLPGTLKSADGGILEPFGPIINDSLITSYNSAKTTTNGKIVSVAFDRKMVDTTVKATDFIVKVNNVINIVSLAKLSTSKDTVHLTLSAQVTKNSDAIQVSYMPGSLYTTIGKFVTSFESKPVTNSVIVPNFLSATTATTGLSVQLNFDQVMANPAGQETNFTVTAAGQAVPVAGVSLLTDKRNILLTLTSSVLKGDSIIVKYNPGSLFSAIGVPVQPFIKGATNKSTLTSSFSISSLASTVYPNPFDDIIYVINNNNFEQITISNLIGSCLISEKLAKGEKAEINTSALKKGIYLITITKNGTVSQVFKLVKN